MQQSKYLVVNERDAQWGLAVSTVGYEEIGIGEEYPTHGHAEGYYFHVNKGRVLNEYQLLYIIEGEGIFQSTHQPPVNIKAGDLFLLFPGEWHTYHPLPEKGWKKYWIGFKGPNIDNRVRQRFLSPEKPVFHVGYSAELVRLYKNAYKTALAEKPYFQQLLAGIVNLQVGLMYSLERSNMLNKNHEHLNMIDRARLRIRETLESGVTIQQIAQEQGVSYSNFRKLFKEYTGISPALYQQDLKLQQAKEMLTTTAMSIKEIAYQLNFESPDYFSSKFRSKTGLRPSEFRNAHQ
ncbi:MAG: AraC family transcriptional regulator [Prevotella sp.]|nr:AraC family transcriptional regulator [Prevotella sp.]